MTTKAGFSFAGGFKHFRLPSLPLVVHVKENKPVIKLQQAARDGREDVVRAWLDRLPRRFGGNVEILNQRDAEGYTALHYAARFNRLSIIQMLVNSGADPSVLSGEKQTALHLAAKHLPRYQTEAADSRATTPRFASSRVVVEYLVHTCQSDVNVRDSYGLTPLHIACARGNLAAVEVLLESANIDVNLPDNKGDSPLHEACVSGSVPIIQRLLQSPHINILAQDNEKMTPLHVACREGHVEVVKTIFQYGMERIAELVKAVDNEKNTPFHLACESGEPEVVQMLLSHGADVGAKRINDKSPMHLAAEGGYVEVAKILFEAGGESTLRAIDDHLCTPLHDAAKNNHVGMVEFLLNSGASINAFDDDSWMPWTRRARVLCSLAAEEGHVDILECLLSHPIGAKLCSTADAAQNTPLHIAAREGKLDVVSILLRVGVQVDARNEVNKTPIHLAAENGHAAVVARLIEHDPDTAKDEDEDSNTPLHCACSHGHLSVAKVLLEANARLDARNASLWTPVDCASAGGWAAIVELLADAQADVCTTDKPNKVTPLHLACREGNVQVVEVLMQNGASVATLDQDGLNCLEVAIENGQTDVAMTIIKSDQWDQALRNCRDYSTPLKKLIHKMPDVAEEALNKCVSSNASKDGPIHANSLEYKLEFIYEFLDDYRDPPSLWERLKGLWISLRALGTQRPGDRLGLAAFIHAFAIMVDRERTNLLKHPLVHTLLDFKWRRYARYMYWSKFVSYVSFLVILTSYTLCLPQPTRAMCSKMETFNCTSPITGTVTDCDVICTGSCLNAKDPESCKDECTRKCHFARVGAAAIIIMSAALLAIKAFQLFSLHFRYFDDPTSVVEPVLYLGAIMFSATFDTPCLCVPDWQWQIGVGVVLLSWVTLLLHMRRVPVTGLYIVMFFDIFYIFCKVVMLLAVLLVAFGLSFYMIFNNPDSAQRLQFSDPYRSISKTMVMMMGEFEYNTVFKQNSNTDDVPYHYLAFPMWALFVILVPVLMTNLLVALAVQDIRGILEAASLKKLALKVEWVLSMDELLPASLRRRLVVGKHIIFPNRKVNICEKLLRAVPKPPENLMVFVSPSAAPLQELHDQSRQLADDVAELKRRLNELSELMVQVTHTHGVPTPKPL
ncbi:hypothetical protein EMCRGX_G034509 [Ephydatia muelleri]